MLSRVYISGATGGLGKNFAVECASRGWNLFLTDCRADRLEIISNSISKAYGIDVDWCACDMADVASRTMLLEEMQRRKVLLHMAVNVAGIDFEGVFLNRTREEILAILNINVASTVDMMHSLPAFRDATRAFHLINVCSLAGMYSMPVKATYASSKRLLISMTLALREEFRAINATATALCPAGMATNEVLLKSLAVQGLASLITTLEVPTIVRRTVDAAQRGKAVYIPGIVNQLMNGVSKLLPETLLAKLICWRWSKTNKEFEKSMERLPA